MDSKKLSTRQKGKIAEDTAQDFLEKNGYTIRARNHWGWGGEVDIVAEIDGVLAFVEVKSGKPYGQSELISKVNRKKIQRIIKATQHYLSVNKITNTPFRWDIITITEGKIRHITSAFTMNYLEYR